MGGDMGVRLRLLKSTGGNVLHIAPGDCARTQGLCPPPALLHYALSSLTRVS